MQDRIINSNVRITDIDKHVGEKLKHKRIMHGLNQQILAEVVDVSMQQIQKYEKGTNRISSGKLYLFAQFFKVPVTYFFEEIAGEFGDYDTSTEREALILFRAFGAIKDPGVKLKILNLIKVMSAIPG